MFLRIGINKVAIEINSQCVNRVFVAKTVSAPALAARPRLAYGRWMSGFPASPMMARALAEARAAAARGEVPVGAVIAAADGTLLAASGNRTRELTDPTAHAEMLAIRAACAALGSERLLGAVLHVTLEPCAMCAAAMAAARVARVVYGAADPKSGGVMHGARVFDHPQAHHVPEIIGGIGESESAALLKAFFAERRR